MEKFEIVDDYRFIEKDYEGATKEVYIVHQVVGEDKEVMFAESDHIISLREQIYQLEESIFSMRHPDTPFNDRHSLEILEEDLDVLEEKLEYALSDGIEVVFDYDTVVGISHDEGSIEWLVDMDKKNKEMGLEP